MTPVRGSLSSDGRVTRPAAPPARALHPPAMRARRHAAAARTTLDALWASNKEGVRVARGSPPMAVLARAYVSTDGLGAGVPAGRAQRRNGGLAGGRGVWSGGGDGPAGEHGVSYPPCYGRGAGGCHQRCQAEPSATREGGISPRSGEGEGSPRGQQGTNG